MKKLFISIVVLCLVLPVFGAVELSDLQNGVFHLAASGFVNEVITHGNGVSSGYRAASNIQDSMAAWLFVEAAQSGSIDIEYPKGTYDNFASRLEYQYTVKVSEGNEAPTGCSGGSGVVTCDAPTNGKTLTLFSWDGATFTDTEKVADEDGDFSSVDPGNYVVGYTGSEFCTSFLVVS